MRSVSPLSNIYGFWHHAGMLYKAAGRYFHIWYLQSNLYSKFGSKQPSSSVPRFTIYFKILA